jgi:hypothetical protein
MLRQVLEINSFDPHAFLTPDEQIIENILFCFI